MFFGSSNNPYKTTRELLASYNYLHSENDLHGVTAQAFLKCVLPSSVRDTEMLPYRGQASSISDTQSTTLTVDEMTCIEEYATLYATFAESAYSQFSKGYEKMARDAMIKMRQAEEMQKGRGPSR